MSRCQCRQKLRCSGRRPVAQRAVPRVASTEPVDISPTFRHHQIYSGPSSDRCLLVHGRYRLDYRPFLYRLWAAGVGSDHCSYEGVPNYPDAGRPWRVAQRLNVNIFHTSPTAIRMLRKAGPDEPAKYDYHFKHMTTVGEPIEPEVWKWYHEVVGKGEAVIVDKCGRRRQAASFAAPNRPSIP